jgi:hypothetical protein
MNILGTEQLEQLVRKAFPARGVFAVDGQLRSRFPLVMFVHGGPDPYLDRELDAWLAGAPTYVQLCPLLNRLCQLGALAPGHYAITDTVH